MWNQFILENAHFALNVFGALVLFAIAWLYFDAWMVRHGKKEGIRTIGYILLSLSFIIAATNVQSAIVQNPFISQQLHLILTLFTRGGGYLLIIISLLMDPVQPKPITEGIQGTSIPKAPAFFALPFSIAYSTILYPLLGGITSGLYLQRASIGLERHLYKVSFGFILLTISELLSLRTLFVSSSNVDIYRLVVSFGLFWYLQQLTLLGGLILLGRWVFGYLLKRFETQLFMIFNVTILIIFLVTTISFTGLLVKNLVDENIRQLKTDAQVLNLAIESKKGEALSDAQVIAQDPRIIESVSKNERRSVADITQSYLLTKKQTSLLVVGQNGLVLANGEDIERYGYSVSTDPLVKLGLTGESASSIVLAEGILAPVVSVRSVVPIKKDSAIIGVVLSGNVIDNALLDGIKKATDLEASVYAGNKLSATTFVTADGITRPLGISEENATIKFDVLGKGNPYSGSVTLLNQPYFGAFLPLSDVNNIPVGMLFVGTPQLTVFSTAGRSIELTFLVTIVLLILSVLPAFGISRYLTSQLK